MARNGSAYVAPTEKMMRYVLNLARERVVPEYGSTADERAAFVQREVDARRLSKFGVMDAIDRLKEAPFDPTANTVGPGVYQNNGEIYLVVLNREKTRLYAKRLLPISGRRLLDADGETVVKADFEYAPGALQRIRPADLMTLDQAEEVLVRYTNCIVCGRHLKDATSVRHSIGPVCIKMFADYQDDDEPDPEVVEAQVETLGELEELAALLGGRS